MKKVYINGSYLSKKQQESLFWDNFSVSNTTHIWEFEPTIHRFYWAKYLFKNFFINLLSSERKNSDIQVFNSVIGCFFYNPQKKNILILHSYDIWVGAEFVAKNTSGAVKYFWVMFLEKLFWNYIQKKIKQFDTVFVSTHDRLEYIKRTLKDDAIWLPNIVQLPWNYEGKKIESITHVFCPERVDNNKWLEIRKQILLYLKNNIKNIHIELLERWEEIDSFTQWLQENDIQVTWIPFLTRDELYQKLSENDLIVGIFQNGALGITNMETMLLKRPLISYDTWESIQVPKEDLLEYTEKILHNPSFREKEIEKNYTYVTDIHTLENYKKIFTQALD